MYSTVIYFACTKGYVVNSCLAPHLIPEDEAVSHSTKINHKVVAIIS